jgi:hypothetical protein
MLSSNSFLKVAGSWKWTSSSEAFAVMTPLGLNQQYHSESNLTGDQRLTQAQTAALLH